MKVKASIKKLCPGCVISQYNQKYYVRCKENPRHKQRQKFSTTKEFPNTQYLHDLLHVRNLGVEDKLATRDLNSLLI